MARENLRLKLQSILSEFSEETGINEEEAHVLAVTMTTLVYSEHSVRQAWYAEMQRTSNLIAEMYRKKAEIILASMNLTEEEKEKVKKEVERKVKEKDKVDN